mmetsp:Transcript_78025/g.142716  ORF Transcript_78025/g.142716 Transcript_78025/m.142716 type:complete len:86 (+) Transcript_78025:148-405(+)
MCEHYHLATAISSGPDCQWQSVHSRTADNGSDVRYGRSLCIEFHWSMRRSVWQRVRSLPTVKLHVSTALCAAARMQSRAARSTEC